MRVIICGADQVGRSIAAYLSKEDNEVTIVDDQKNIVAQITDDMDVNTIAGHPSNPDVLKAAGANDADMIIAVTNQDEVNMVACQIGHSLFGIPKKIARIRLQNYLDPAWSNLFSRAHMPIDVIVSPEQIVAQDIYNRLSIPGTTSVVHLADGKVHLIGVLCQEECPLLNTQFSQFAALFPDLDFRIVYLRRNNKNIIPDGNEMLEVGDEAYIVVNTKHLRRVMSAFGHHEKEARRIIISGGGNIGTSLIRRLQTFHRGMQIKVIERNEERARFLSEEMSNILVLHGDTLARGLLDEASVRSAEAYVALTNDDETNILGSLLAKQYGCERTVTLVNNNVYYPLVGPLGIDVMVSPRSIIVSNIMQHVRRGRIKGIHNIRDGYSEVIEIEVSDVSRVVNKKTSDLDLPLEVVIAAVVRGDEVIMGAEDLVLKTKDRVIIWTTRDKAAWVEKIFTVHVNMI